MAEIAELKAMLTQLTQKWKFTENEFQNLKGEVNSLKTQNNTSIKEYKDIETTYLTGEAIQLDALKAIPEFDGNQNECRSWRSQVTKQMSQIENFKNHPKYAPALGIIRAKVTKTASNILINNNTAHDIDAIIDRLDFSFADQRPLYVIEAEMTSQRQENKSLQEFYDSINQALNLVIKKISMTYKSLIAEAKLKSIRTFITGLNISFMRTTLYGNSPKSLAEAFAIVQTVFYDNQILKVDKRNNEKVRSKHTYATETSKFNPNFMYGKQEKAMEPNNFFQKPSTSTRQHEVEDRPVPMDVDTSLKSTKPNQQGPVSAKFGKIAAPLKKEFVLSKNHSNAPKFQRVNAIDDITRQYEEYDSVAPEVGEQEDTMSINSLASTTPSAFLGA